MFLVSSLSVFLIRKYFFSENTYQNNFIPACINRIGGKYPLWNNTFGFGGKNKARRKIGELQIFL